MRTSSVIIARTPTYHPVILVLHGEVELAVDSNNNLIGLQTPFLEFEKILTQLLGQLILSVDAISKWIDFICGLFL